MMLFLGENPNLLVAEDKMKSCFANSDCLHAAQPNCYYLLLSWENQCGKGKVVWKSVGKMDLLRSTSMSRTNKRVFVACVQKLESVLSQPGQLGPRKSKRKFSDFKHFMQEISLCWYESQKKTWHGKVWFTQTPLLLLLEWKRPARHCWCAVTSWRAATPKGWFHLITCKWVVDMC